MPVLTSNVECFNYSNLVALVSVLVTSREVDLLDSCGLSVECGYASHSFVDCLLC